MSDDGAIVVVSRESRHNNGPLNSILGTIVGFVISVIIFIGIRLWVVPFLDRVNCPFNTLSTGKECYVYTLGIAAVVLFVLILFIATVKQCIYHQISVEEEEGEEMF